MQGQDLGVLSSVALRTASGSIDEVLDLLRERRLVRGYPMRGTVFLGAARDLRWITELCSPGIVAQGRAAAEKSYGVGARELDSLREALHAHPAARGDGLTRAEYKELAREALPHLDHSQTGVIYQSLFQLIIEHDVVYSGWHGRDQRVALAEGILGPGLEELFEDRTAATAELMSRYFRTRGPATLADFRWWSKLKVSEIKKALPLLADDVDAVERDGDTVYVDTLLAERLPGMLKEAERPRLLPAFDEFILGYQYRLFAMTPKVHDVLVPQNRGVFRKAVVVGGTVRGTWTRSGSAGRRQLSMEAVATIPKSAAVPLRKRFEAYPFAIA